MKKRILAIALTLAMLLSMLPAQVFATGPVINGGIHTEHSFVEVQPQQSTQTPEAEDPSAEKPPLKGAQTEASPILGLLDYDAAVADLTYLSQVIGSRLAGSKPESLAQDYVAAEFQKLGYEVTRQDVPIAKNGWFSGTVGEVYVGDLTLAANTPTNNEYYTGFGQASGTAVYLEDPADVPSLGSDLSGKIVFFPGNWRSGKDPDTISAIQALDAANAEAIVALLDLSIDAAEAEQKYLPSLSCTSSMQISTPVLLCNAMEAERVPAYLAEHPGIQVTVDSRNSNTYSQNVIGLKKAAVETDWTIYVSAHIDSVLPSPGANDNGSGVVGVLAMARAFKDIETNYNIAFVTVGAEEIGLVGSAYYADNLTDGEIKHAIGNYNIDMIATSAEGCDYIYMMSPTTAFSLTDNSVENRVVLSTYRAAEQLGYDMNYVTAVKEWASDHSSFNDVGIPAVGYIWSTSGTSLVTEDYYHTINDSMVNGINFSAERLKKMVDLVATAVYNDATADYVAVVGDGVNRECYTTIEEAQVAAGEGGKVSLFNPHAHCVYGENCEYVKEGKKCEHDTTEFATPLTNADFASSVNVAGSYYLTEDVEMTANINFNCGGTIYLCLNGNTISGNMFIEVTSGTKLYLCNCTRETDTDAFFHIQTMNTSGSATEVHVCGGTLAENSLKGSQILDYSKFYLEGGTFIADPGTESENATAYCGGDRRGGYFILESGKMINKGAGAAAVAHLGLGTLTLSGDVQMEGGPSLADIWLWTYTGGDARITLTESFDPKGKVYSVYFNSGYPPAAIASGGKHRLTTGWDAVYHKVGYIPFESTQGYEVIEYYENGVVELYLINAADQDLFKQHYHVLEDGRRVYYTNFLTDETWPTDNILREGGYLLTQEKLTVSDINICDGQRIDICLNGNELYTEQILDVGDGTYFRIDDCSDSGAVDGGGNRIGKGKMNIHAIRYGESKTGTNVVLANGNVVCNRGTGLSVSVHVSGIFEMLGGTLSSTGATYMLEVWGPNYSEFYLRGGIIDTTASYAVGHDSARVELSGSPIISGANIDINLSAGYKISFDNDNALVPPEGETYTVQVSEAVSATNPVRFTDGWDNSGLSSKSVTGGNIPFVSTQGYAIRELYCPETNGLELYLTADPIHSHDVSTETGNEAPITFYTPLEEEYLAHMTRSSGIMRLGGGKFFLTHDVSVPSNVTAIEIIGEAYLCLNGHSLDLGELARLVVYGDGGSLRLCDCHGGGGEGKITSSCDGSTLHVEQGGLCYIYGGTVENTRTQGVTVTNHGPLYTKGQTYIYGGTLVGNKTGIFATAGTVEISGGTVQVNTDQSTIALRIADSAKAKMTGGTLKALGEKGLGINASDDVEIEITGGTIQATHYGISHNCKSVTVSGDPIIETGSADFHLQEGKTVTIGENFVAPTEAYTVVTVARPTEGNPVQVTISSQVTFAPAVTFPPTRSQVTFAPALTQPITLSQVTLPPASTLPYT